MLVDRLCAINAKSQAFLHIFSPFPQFSVQCHICLLSPAKKAAGDMVIVSVRLSFPPTFLSKAYLQKYFRYQLNFIKEACSVQEPLLYLQYFWSYCPSYIFFLEFLSGAYLQKYFRYQLNFIKEACSV